MTALTARDRVDGSKPDTPNGVNVANLLLGLGNLYDCVQTLGIGVSSVAAGTATFTQANAGLVLADASAGNIIINLPACSAAVGAVYQFKRVDATANTVTINRAGGDTIDGVAAITLIEALDFVGIRSDGVSTWRALNNTVVATKEVTTAGTDIAYAIVPAPALNAYKAGRSYWVKFHAASGLNPTLQISGLATPPNLVMQQADGTYINVVGIPINHRSLVTLISATQALVVTMPPSSAKKPGEIFMFAGSSAPAGSLVCPVAQTNISRTTYASLFAAIGTTWGAGDGSTTFGMPWFAANYAPVQANANVGTATVGEVIAHTHSAPVISGSGNAQGGPTVLANGLTGSTGGAANLAAGVRVLFCVQF